MIQRYGIFCLKLNCHGKGSLGMKFLRNNFGYESLMTFHELKKKKFRKKLFV